MPVHNQQNKYTKKQSDLAVLKQLFGAGSAGCDKELFSSMQATTVYLCVCVCTCVFMCMFDTLGSILSTKNKNVVFIFIKIK